MFSRRAHVSHQKSVHVFMTGTIMRLDLSLRWHARHSMYHVEFTTPMTSDLGTINCWSRIVCFFGTLFATVGHGWAVFVHEVVVLDRMLKSVKIVDYLISLCVQRKRQAYTLYIKPILCTPERVQYVITRWLCQCLIT